MITNVVVLMPTLHGLVRALRFNDRRLHQEDCTCRRGVVKYDKGRMHLMPKPLVISVISGMSEIAGKSKIIDAVLYFCFSSVL